MGPHEELTAAPPHSWGHGLSSAPRWARGSPWLLGVSVPFGPWASLCPLRMRSRGPPVTWCRASLPQVILVTGVCSGEKHRKKPCTVFTLHVSWQVTPGRVKDEAERWRARWRRAPVHA